MVNRITLLFGNKINFKLTLFYLFFQISFCQNANNLVISCPGDMEITCDQNPEIEFANWISGFGYSGGNNVITTDLSGYVVPQPGEMIDVFYLVSDAEHFEYCKAIFRVPKCNISICTNSQGFYGNCNGKTCTNLLGLAKSQAIMKNAITNHGGEFNFGSTATGNYFKLKATDIFGNSNECNNSIFKLLPGGGTPRALVNFSTYSDYATWSDSNPMYASGPNMGKINNVLLSQTITLFFNLEIETNLSNVVLEPQFSTVATTYCGSNIPIAESEQTFNINQAVINYLNVNYGKATVGNLFLLANKALGGEFIGSLNCSKINDAVDAINRGYDKCRIKVVNPLSEAFNITPSYDSKVDFVVSPIPFEDYITIKYLFNYESSISIQIFDVRGKILLEVKDDNAYLNKEFKIEMPTKLAPNEALFLNIKTEFGNLVKTIIAK